jgi:hypothetical protein
MHALLSGLVFNVMPERGVVIAATGALIEAAWGTGEQSSGRLRVLTGSPDQAMTPELVLPTCQGYVVVGGQLSRRETLQQAARVRVRGMIVGSLHADLFPLLQVLPYPVLLTEGFGKMGMLSQTFSLLQDHDGREAMLSTVSPVSGIARRPEILIPVESTAEFLSYEHHPLRLTIGSEVRGLRAPYLGQQGRIVALPNSPQLLESGLQQSVAKVELTCGQQAWIPLINLEAIRDG